MFKLSFRKTIISTLLTITICLALFSGCNEKRITGNEWLVKQETCLDDLKAYAGGMDEVYTLYLTGAITQDDFLMEYRLLKAQYISLNQFYEELKKENPVKEGSHSYVSKRGTEGIENCYSVLGKVLTDTLDNSGKPKPANELAYVYLAYKQELTTALSEYVTAILWLESGQEST